MKDNIPFVGLHAHSVAGSMFDGYGYPQEHMDFAFENGMDALALTDHGNMNGLPYQILHAQKMASEGKNFKPIFGVEAYFVPSVKEWKKEYDRVKEDKKAAKKLSRDSSGVTMEDENASKRTVNNVLNRRRHLILLAQNEAGLKNIFAMISESFRDENFYRYPRVDYSLLEKYNEGVIAASACLGGVYAGDYWENRDSGEDAIVAAMHETTQNMMSIFGDRWYGELQWNNVPEQHKLNKLIIQMHYEFGIGLISTADSHYPSADAWQHRELYKRLGWLGKSTSRPDYLSDELPVDVDEIGYELYPKNGQQMWEAYKKYSKEVGAEYDDELILKSITNTHEIAHQRIEKFMPDSTVRLPDFVVPTGQTPTGALTKLCIEGLKARKLTSTDYIDRLKSELEVIDSRGFSKYFLTMAAISNCANETMLTGPGRGSAAGSLVAYALGITQIDPLKYGLLFSRFLRSDAKDYPDIDYDVADPMKIKEILIEKWGKNNVVPISNFNTLKLRSLIKDISKFYGVPFPEVNLVTSKMMKEATPLAKKKHGIKAGVYTPTFEEVMEFSTSLRDFLEKYPLIKEHVTALHGSPRSVSRHAGGVVIGENLNEHMPLISSGGVIQTPWSEGQNVRHLEPLGFIKFDILGLSTLRMIETAVEHILKRHHGIEEPTHQDVKNFYDTHLHPDKIDINDPEVYKNIFHKGRWAGIFQFTEKGAQAFCRRAKPTSIVDIAAVTSIFRPGPLSAKVDKFYVEAKNNAEDIEYVNQVVREVTEETYGFLIFQEQIALLAHRLGENLSLDEGNLLRKLLTKKGTGKGNEQKEKIYNKFIKGCTSRGLSRGAADELWQKFEYFSGYGFNKSHAVSYSILSFQCAWLFNSYPAEWMAAFLDKEPESRKEAAVNIAKKFRFKLQPVDVNRSGTVWEISDDGKTLIQPFSSVKGLGDKAMEQIILHRPFETIEDFLFNEEIVYSKLNKKALDVLCRSGALSPLMDERFTGLKHFWSAVACDRPKNKKKFQENIELYAPEGEFTKEETIDNVTSLTGEFPMHLVLDKDVREQLEKHKVPPVGDWDNDLGVAWFIPRQIVPRKTKNGKDYWIVHVLDDTNKITYIKCWGVRAGKDIVHLNHPYMAKLDYDPQWGFSTRSISHTWRLLG